MASDIEPTTKEERATWLLLLDAHTSNRGWKMRDAMRRLIAQVERLQGIVIKEELWTDAPCCLCGYNGPGYYQSDTHECARLASEQLSG